MWPTVQMGEAWLLARGPRRLFQVQLYGLEGAFRWAPTQPQVWESELSP